jgi:hypothetical protein
VATPQGAWLCGPAFAVDPVHLMEALLPMSPRLGPMPPVSPMVPLVSDPNRVVCRPLSSRRMAQEIAR